VFLGAWHTVGPVLLSYQRVLISVNFIQDIFLSGEYLHMPKNVFRPMNKIGFSIN
jgi:hypothetical protein